MTADEYYKQAYREAMQTLPPKVIASLKTIYQYCIKHGECEGCKLVHLCVTPIKWYGRCFDIGEGKVEVD